MLSMFFFKKENINYANTKIGSWQKNKNKN